MHLLKVMEIVSSFQQPLAGTKWVKFETNLFCDMERETFFILEINFAVK